MKNRRQGDERHTERPPEGLCSDSLDQAIRAEEGARSRWERHSPDLKTGSNDFLAFLIILGLPAIFLVAWLVASLQ
jgi:hypothetical protein